ncbi:hypothetical protein [Aestuariimicrobium sp. T2.26MG-19.2B]|uniref:hypothetical protein n=1 Tax=Aestuariimicrobium sp. T2.26MG-19.2B TaxID=3040679 RepID=UPI0024776635|nr:hypothetical protein [Aestuariimicrobium sp. T2.26MG-19.2B]CAI9411765.1 hypothetical protein AESSP_02716 [Aestuariimicrobium sp. T2.26MG-19.2B]
MGIAEEAAIYLEAEQAKRLEVIRQLEPFVAIRAELEQRMAQVDADQRQAWDAAIASGWTADQLHRLRLDEPTPTKPANRRRPKPRRRPTTDRDH